jgi:putative transposase
MARLAQLKGRLKLSDAERATLGEIGHRLGHKVLAEVANVARPDTILAWYRKLVARKFDGSKARRRPGRPRIKREVEQLIVRMAEENRDWGYDRIAGALANLGYKVCDQTVGNVLERHALPPAPERKRTTTWPAFIRIHLALLAGTDFLTAEVLTLRFPVFLLLQFFDLTGSRRRRRVPILGRPGRRDRHRRVTPVTLAPGRLRLLTRRVVTSTRPATGHLLSSGSSFWDHAVNRHGEKMKRLF